MAMVLILHAQWVSAKHMLAQALPNAANEVLVCTSSGVVSILLATASAAGEQAPDLIGGGSGERNDTVVGTSMCQMCLIAAVSLLLLAVLVLGLLVRARSAKPLLALCIGFSVGPPEKRHAPSQAPPRFSATTQLIVC